MKTVNRIVALAVTFSAGLALGAYIVPKEYKIYELARSITFPDTCESTTTIDLHGTRSHSHVVDSTGTLYFSSFGDRATCADFQRMWRQK